MKIRTALTLKYLCVTATVFALCMVAIYFVSEHTRSRTFYNDLHREGVTKAHLFLKKKTDKALMQAIYLNNREFIHEVEVAVYTPDFQMLYNDAMVNDIVKETPEMIARILRERNEEFTVGDYQAVGFVYEFEGKPYVVTAAAYDGVGHDNIAELQRTLGALFAVGLVVLFAVGYLLARSSLKPIRTIVREVKQISASRIDRRLPVASKTDELGELSITFNDMLQRLEGSFEAQKMFVSNVSHEMRTPLAALTAEIDLTLQKDRTLEQYRAALSNALNDAHRMTRLIDGLLNLAKADYRKEAIKMQEIRLDELLLDVRAQILRVHPGYRVELIFEQESDDDSLITVSGNLYLLTIAFSNLIENNCKYSANNTSFVQISFWKEWSAVRLSDTGKGLTEEEKQRIFQLFYRGDNTAGAEGHGIGMALAQKIIHLHGGNIAVLSEKGKGTTFVVELPHV